MKGKKDIKVLAQKFIDNTSTEQEVRQLLHLLRSQRLNPEFEAVIDDMIMKVGSDESLKKRADTEEHNLKINAILSLPKSQEHTVQRVKTHRLRFPQITTIRIAAVVIVSLIATLSIYILNTKQEIQMLVNKTVAGHKATITLNDGSTVRLNSETTLTYPEKFNSNIREVFIEGEAYFTVKPNENKPFIVKSKHLTTKVLGTSFNVRAFNDEDRVEVVVASGRVVVESQATDGIAYKEIILGKNEMLTFDVTEKTMTKATGDLSQLIAWKDGTLVFDGIELREVVKELERWFGIDINLENEQLGSCLIKAEFRNRSLDRILELIEWGMDDFGYEFGDEGVMIKGSGCRTEM